MRRFWVEKDAIVGELVDVEGESYKHMVKVCRLKVGDKAEVLCGDPEAIEVEVLEITKKKLTAKILNRRPLPEPAKPHINLLLCFPKINNLEHIIEKAVELGCYSIQLLFNDYSFIKNSKEIKASKWERWNKIIQSATEQSGRGQLMKLEPPKDFAEFMSSFNPSAKDPCLMFYEGDSPLDARSGLESLKGDQPDSVWVLVGSEGGFSEAEVEITKAKNIPVLTLGPQILRVETACVSILSVLKYEFDLMRA